jgi:hypothetical protein
MSYNWKLSPVLPIDLKKKISKRFSLLKMTYFTFVLFFVKFSLKSPHFILINLATLFIGEVFIICDKIVFHPPNFVSAYRFILSEANGRSRINHSNNSVSCFRIHLQKVIKCLGLTTFYTETRKQLRKFEISGILHKSKPVFPKLCVAKNYCVAKIVKIFLFQNCQNFPFQTVKIFLF